MNIKILFYSFIAIGFVGLSQISLSQSQNSVVGDIEELVTKGERSTLSLKFELINAEDAVFEIFNEAYSGTDYEMICSSAPIVKDEFVQHRPSPTSRTCVTEFVREQEEIALQEMLAGNFTGNLDYLDANIDSHNEELGKMILKLYNESPEFREQFGAYSSLKRRYDASAENAESGGIFSGLFGKKESK